MVRSRIPKPFQDYQDALRELDARGAHHEGARRIAFHNLLDSIGRERKLKVVAENPGRTAEGRAIRVDGHLLDTFNTVHGTWESKGEGADLHREAERKRKAGYPTDNFLIENSRQALLLQDGQVQGVYELGDWRETERALTRFLSYRRPQMERFYAAADEFNQRIPQLAAELAAIIARQKRENPRFRQALDDFLEVCRGSVNAEIRLTAGMSSEYEDLLPMGSKAAKQGVAGARRVWSTRSDRR